MKSFVKQLIPPLVLDVIRASKNKPPPIFASYELALKACESGAYHGDDLVKVVIEKNRLYRESINESKSTDSNVIQTIMAVALARYGDSLSVIDFGGGGGFHHSIAKLVFGESIRFRWNVIETSAMTSFAQGDSELKFFDNAEDAKNDLGKVDLLFSSGALQYCQNPIETLGELTAIRAKHLFITRTALTEESRALIGVQHSRLSDNGPGPMPIGFVDRQVSYPIIAASRELFETTLKKSYDIRFHVKESIGAHKIGDKEISTHGYFCTLKD